MVAEQMREAVVHVIGCQVVTELSLVVLDSGQTGVVGQEGNGGSALGPQPGAVVWTKTRDGPHRGARIFSIKEVGCKGGAFLDRLKIRSQDKE